ncbi:hypothetical protein OG474_41045 [Kribbella sp. NBC_01505]|uniref:hypothetical protein n=1 Tax=Kribbella sp. NBC_01505 TaxID=2903580 RepID=UPI00386C8A14
MAQSDSAMPVVPAGVGRSTSALSDAPDASTTASAAPVQSVPDQISGPAAAVPAMASAAAAAAVPGAGLDAAALDALARQLYEPLVRRLRAELRLDREREGTLMDRPW